VARGQWTLLLELRSPGPRAQAPARLGVGVATEHDFLQQQQPGQASRKRARGDEQEAGADGLAGDEGAWGQWGQQEHPGFIPQTDGAHCSPERAMLDVPTLTAGRAGQSSAMQPVAGGSLCPAAPAGQGEGRRRRAQAVPQVDGEDDGEEEEEDEEEGEGGEGRREAGGRGGGGRGGLQRTDLAHPR